MRCALLSSALLLAVTPGPAYAEWSSLTSAHFHVVGDATARDLRDVALRLEQFREVFLKLAPGAVTAAGESRIVAVVFRDERSFRPFMPRANGRRVPVAGVFAGGPAGNYIALSLEAGDEAFPAIYHEYSHVLLARTFPGAPLWFNEGLAEYYSTLEITSDGRRALIGKPIERHVARVRERRLPLDQLLSIRASSPEYTSDTPQRELVYAQSWAVVHHALQGMPARRNELVNLAVTLASGSSPDQGVREAYGMSVSALESQLEAYVRRSIYQSTMFEFTDPIATRVSGTVTRADEPDVDAWLGALLLTMGSVDEAVQRLERALRARPDHGTAHLSMAFVRDRQGRRDEARGHFEKARAAGIAPAGTSTVRVRLSDSEGRQFLGTQAVRAGDYLRARELLGPVVEADPRNHDAALVLAEALIHLGDAAGARRLLGPVLAQAADAQRSRARTLLGKLAELPPPPADDASDALPRRDAPPPVPVAPAESGPPPTPPVRPLLREIRPGEQQTRGTLLSVECRSNGIVIAIRSEQQVVRAQAARFDAVDFVTYRTVTGSSIRCGTQPAEPALLTWRPQVSGLPIAVALELLPDGLVP